MAPSPATSGDLCGLGAVIYIYVYIRIDTCVVYVHLFIYTTTSFSFYIGGGRTLAAPPVTNGDVCCLGTVVYILYTCMKRKN